MIQFFEHLLPHLEALATALIMFIIGILKRHTDVKKYRAKIKVLQTEIDRRDRLQRNSQL
jgi:hypothetical protein